MQPKDFIPKTPENDKKLQRKFEKMTKELQRRKTAPDNNVPVFLLESCGSLTYSSSVKINSYQDTMEKRLQEMKEKREHLSPTSSQRTELAQETPDDSLCEASVNISGGTLYAGESFAGDLHSSLDDLCGNQERKLEESVKEIKSEACNSSPVLRTGHTGSLASSGSLSELDPQKPPGALPKEGINWPQDPGGEIVTLERKQAAEVSEMSEEKQPVSCDICNQKASLAANSAPELLGKQDKGVCGLVHTSERNAEEEEEQPEVLNALHTTAQVQILPTIPILIHCGDS